MNLTAFCKAAKYHMVGDRPCAPFWMPGHVVSGPGLIHDSLVMLRYCQPAIISQKSIE